MADLADGQVIPEDNRLVSPPGRIRTARGFASVS
jgi:hypothetical protein